MSNESKFIEVLGESSFIEKPTLYPVEMEIRMTCSPEEKNTILQQFSALEESALKLIEQFKDSISRSIDGGRRINSYRDRRKLETTVSRKFILHFQSMNKLEEIWNSVLEFNSSESKSISFEPSQPIFKASSEHEQGAHDAAIASASLRASSLAKSSGLKIGPILFAKQLALTERNSGAYSDEDWWGDAERFRPRYHIGGTGMVELDEPERVIYVRYLVRYEVENA